MDQSNTMIATRGRKSPVRTHVSQGGTWPTALTDLRDPGSNPVSSLSTPGPTPPKKIGPTAHPDDMAAFIASYPGSARIDNNALSLKGGQYAFPLPSLPHCSSPIFSPYPNYDLYDIFTFYDLAQRPQHASQHRFRLSEADQQEPS